MENLIAGVAGALLTALAGLIGLLWSKRTEQSQWLRNQKIEVYTTLLRQAHASSNSLDYYKATGKQAPHNLEGVVDLTNARLMIIAPYMVRQEAQLYRSTLETAGQAQYIENDELFQKWQVSRSRSYNSLETAIRKDLGTHEKVRKSLKMRFWSVVYFFTDPFHKWYFRKYGVAWTTKHPTRAMRKHMKQRLP